MLEIITHAPNAHELRRDGVRVAVVDDIADARKLAAVDELLDACKAAVPLLERFFEELKVAEIDEVGRCPACSCYGEYCSNHKMQHDLLNTIPSILEDIAKAEGK